VSIFDFMLLKKHSFAEGMLIFLNGIIVTALKKDCD